MLQLFVLALLGISAHGYIWQNVQTPDSYDENTVFYQSSTGNKGSCGYTDSAVGWFAMNTARCYIPFQGEEFEVVLPYDVLVTEPYKEVMIWTFIYTAEEIRDEAVQVCDNCDGGNDIYVCASTEWGPGKLIVRDDNSVNCYVSYNGDEHVMSDWTTLTYQPAVEYRLTEVNYLLDDLDLLADEPTQLTELIVINEDSQTQTSTHTLTYSKTSSNEWENSLGFALGITMSVSAGIPLFVETGWEVGIEQSWSYAYGESYSETITTSTEATVSVPARHTCTLSIVAREMICDVPYDATATVIYPDGSTTTEFISGIYEGLSVNQDQVVFEPCISID